MSKRYLTLCVRLLAVAGVLIFTQPAGAQTTDSLLREQLTRGVQYWQQGKPVDAYTALDSVLAQPLTPDIAATKVKAAIWTATYLQQQKKYPAAHRFLDSARTWAEQYARGEEYRRVYETWTQLHLATGNYKGALASQQESYKIKDSLDQLSYSARIDSLQQVMQSANAARDTAAAKMQSSTSTTESPSMLTIGLGVLSLILLLVVFRMNTSLQRMKTLPPAPQPSYRPEPVREVAKEKTQETKQVVAEKIKLQSEPEKQTQVAAAVAPPPPSLTAAPVNSKDLTVKLAEVELVLIRPDVLGRYGNGEWKSVKNLLNEYLSQLPLILKNLDDAINKSETAPILQGLEYLKPYLQPFGMTSTLALIQEVEEEATQVKASKLLSRVFQVRNHTRRAADEAKSIIEKFS
jgi:hypothetical protein